MPTHNIVLTLHIVYIQSPETPPDEDKHGFLGGMQTNGGVGWSVHSGHARTVVLAGVTADVNL